MRLMRGTLLLLAVFMLHSGGGEASPIKTIPADKVERLTLQNGMTFLLMPHGETPVFSAYIRMKVGGIDEPQGLTGLSHLVEHMAFKGTRQWGSKDWEKEKIVLEKIESVGQDLAGEYAKGEQADSKRIQSLRDKMASLYQEHEPWVEREEMTRAIQSRGGLDLNATTGQDLTNYFVSLPSEELEFWAKLDAERIFEPVFREFYRERDVVLEERRLRVVDSPVGAFYTEFLEKSFAGSPYHRPTIGYLQDLLTITRTRALEFFRRHYRPDRAVGALVGRFKMRQAKKILRETFGRVPLPEAEPVNLPEQRAIKKPPYDRESCRLDMVRSAQPRLAMGFHKPQMPDRDDYIFDVIATLLSRDRNSWLYRNLVMEKGLAVSVDAYAGVPGARLPNMFMIYAVPRIGVPLDRLFEEISVILTELQDNSLEESDLARAKKQIISDQVWRLERNKSLAAELSYFEAISGDWHYLLSYADEIETISVGDVQAVARKYFVPGNRCLGFLQGGAS